MATSNTTISLEIIESNGNMNFYFTVKLTAKTHFFISIMGKDLFVQKLRGGQLVPGGQRFAGVEGAVKHYKNKNMKAAIELIPDYIASGLTGEVSI